MELMQLRYFKEVARQENISRAAENLHITQSALSKSISKLEAEMGFQLLERQGNRIHLNQFGRVLLRYADQALCDLENGLAHVRELAGLEDGMVRVGVSAEVFVKHLVRDFLLEHPGVSMTCLLQSPEQMAASLLEGTADFTISTDPVGGDGLSWQPLYTDRLTVLISTAHPLAGRSSIYLEELANDAFIITNLGFGMSNNTRELCRRAGFEPKVLYEGYDNDMTGALVERGLAVQITPHSISEGVSRFLPGPPLPQVTKVPLSGDFTQKIIGVTARRGHFQSAAALAFYEKVVHFFTSLEPVYPPPTM